MKNNAEPLINKFRFAFNSASEKFINAELNWVRNVLTIMTPSLMLLIGLEKKPIDAEPSYVVFLVSSIISMALTIFIGVFFLKSEQAGYSKLRNEIDKAWIEKRSLPNGVGLDPIYIKLRSTFSVLTLLSLALITCFGVLKYLY